MKIGAVVKSFNYVMRERRAELGLSQKRLSEASGVRLEVVATVENLKLPPGSFGAVRDALNKIAQVLELDFQDLFPDDYLDALQRKILPRRTKPVVWVREVSIAELPVAADCYQIESPEYEVLGTIEDTEMKNALATALSLLTNGERKVIEMRFGLVDGVICTLEETGRHLGVTRERIRQIEAQALRKLRHPTRANRFRSFLTEWPNPKVPAGDDTNNGSSLMQTETNRPDDHP